MQTEPATCTRANVPIGNTRAPSPRCRRQANYTVLFAVSLAVLLAFGAIAVDTTYSRLAQAQAQDIADAASQAALIVLRQGGDTSAAEDAAARVVQANRVGGKAPQLEALAFGTWDDTDAHPTFTPDDDNPNAVRTVVGRTGLHEVPTLLAFVLGHDSFPVRAFATSASRSFQIVFVLDITGSWGERDFGNARIAVVNALDTLSASASGIDRVGMSIFTNRYAWEYTPFSAIANSTVAATVRSEWSVLNIASKAGTDKNHYDGTDCKLKTGSSINDFSKPSGGCYPDMPREYRDESGTDHSTGILLAKQMFEEGTVGASYRAMIVVTDGRPNDLGATSGASRQAAGYVETRWNEYLGPVPRTKDDIRYASIEATEDLWQDHQVNTWVVSFIENDWMMPEMVQGDGYFVRTSNSTQLSAILEQIISEMPLAIVE